MVHWKTLVTNNNQQDSQRVVVHEEPLRPTKKSMVDNVVPVIFGKLVVIEISISN